MNTDTLQVTGVSLLTFCQICFSSRMLHECVCVQVYMLCVYIRIGNVYMPVYILCIKYMPFSESLEITL